MPIFEYQAIDSNGKKQKGKIDADTKKQAMQLLQAQKYYLLSLEPVRGSNAWSQKTRKSLLHKGIPKQIILEFTRNFSVLVNAGVPYDKAFEIIIHETEHSEFQEVASSLRAKVMEGSSLAASMETQPKIFSKMYTSMVQAGELGGTLAIIMDRLASYQEEQSNIKSKIQTAMIYPIIMSLLGIAIVIMMITFILPRITPIFERFGAQLPLPTRIVIWVSNIVINYWWLILFGIVLLVIAGKNFFNTPYGANLRDKTLLKLPVVNNVLRKLAFFRLTQTLGTLMESGVDLSKSLLIIKHIMGNLIYEKAMDQISLDVSQKGFTLNNALKKTNLFPLSLVQIVRVGEETGNLEKLLLQVSEHIKEEVNQVIQNAVAVLEPMIILVMALFVGFIVMAVMLPMFEMSRLF